MLKYWFAAIRPKTLSVAVVPVLLGSTLGWADSGSLNWAVMAAAVLAAVLIQAGTNLHNDAADFERGADNRATRLGPRRASAEGWLSSSQVRRGALLSFAAAGVCGSYLVWRGGWPILVIGLASIGAAIAYSGGPRPIAYSRMGEFFVWLFFGLIAVVGTYFLHTGRLSWGAVSAGSALGMPAAAVLVVNNYRDLDDDRRVGRLTVAVRYGRRASQVEYTLLMLSPFALLPLLPAGGEGRGAWLLLPLAVLPWAVWLVRRFRREQPGPVFNQLLASTAQYQLCFGLLLCLGLMLARAAIEPV